MPYCATISHAHEADYYAASYETRWPLLKIGSVLELYCERKASIDLLGNIYRGKVIRVLPGMQAAFVDIGIERTAFLYVSDVHKDILNVEQIMFHNSEMDDDPDLSGPEPLIPGHFDSTHYNIEELLREGQHLMVQVYKEPLAIKGQGLLSYIHSRQISRLMPTVDHRAFRGR